MRVQIADSKGKTLDLTPSGSVPVSSNAQGAVAVTPSDSTDLSSGITTGLFIGGAGNVVVTMANGVDVTFTGVLAGNVYYIAVKRVKATLTTATNIIALY